MKLTDLTVEVRDKDLNRLGLIRHEELDLKVTDEFNNVGTWELAISVEHALAPALSTPGAGLIVTGPQGTLQSGPVIKRAYHSSKADPLGTLTVNGVSDSVILSDMLAWPDPSNPDVTTQAFAHDTRTGVAETIMHGYVNANVGPGAPDPRKRANLIMGTDLARGPTVTKDARFPVLGNLLSEIAALGDLGFYIVQDGGSLVFKTYQSVDRRDEIRLDVWNNTLESQDVEVLAPLVTEVIVAGQNQGVDRQFILRNNADSLSAESVWGRRIETFIDQRQTNDVTQLQQAGDEELTKGGFEAASAKAQPMDDTTMRFGYEWGLGDKVSIIYGDAQSWSNVTGYVLVANSDGVKLGTTIGTPYSVHIGQAFLRAKRRLSALERAY